MDVSVFLAGFSLSLSLILPIGSQNAFILKQGFKRQHVFAVCCVCAISDAILISSGVAGFGSVVNRYPTVEVVARYGGAVFLVTYAFLSFRSAFTVDHALKAQDNTSVPLWKSITMCLAFTWLNPHVYLDTLVLLGSVSTQYHPNQLDFGIGAVLASFAFFFSLGFGAKLLAPVFAKPVAWKILECAVGVVMLVIATALIMP